RIARDVAAVGVAQTDLDRLEDAVLELVLRVQPAGLVLAVRIAEIVEIEGRTIARGIGQPRGRRDLEARDVPADVLRQRTVALAVEADDRARAACRRIDELAVGDDRQIGGRPPLRVQRIVRGGRLARFEAGIGGDANVLERAAAQIPIRCE
ncbi:hypothetical protein ABG067_009063, partial [Albugo candida]